MGSSRRAVLLTSNFISGNDEQYYQKMLLGAEDLFVHTWSLCVEMQWYLIIPAIFVVQRLTTSWEKTFVAGIAGCSITFYLGADNTTAFYSIFARLWQFLCGVVAFLAQDKTTTSAIPRQYKKSSQHALEQQCLLATSQDETIKEEANQGCNTVVDNEKWLHVVAIFIFTWEVMLSLIWFALPSHILRLATTIQTGAVVYIGSLQKIALLGDDALAYLGDISYALYLFHWPVYVIVKPHSLEQPLGTFNTLKPWYGGVG
ncbi:hypothetical protein ANCCAN_10921 [Ancylostoma caninum]|uniref:Acyltransferase 3 domain-containing protein n=1 Tax=Ancylostoma caninum TaxID=29170 RepID=A0A368GHD3_ANCCA|nr:hypothetical protein ANCCAN_10921 [Ancylostoma caninum]